MRRRGLLAAALGALLGGVSEAQEAAPQPAVPKPARRPRRRRPAPAAKPQDLAPNAEVVVPARPEKPVFEAAPVPNRDLEAPRVVEKDAPSLTPSVIQRPLPSRGQATEGSVSLQEERLFDPAPGARLNVPFRY